MAAIAMLDLLRRNPNFGVQAFNSRTLFTTASSASFAFTAPFAFGALFGDGITQIAYCDAGATLDEDYISSIRPRTQDDEEDDDFPPENSEERQIDLVVPFKKSVKQIIRESSVITTRRVLERLAVHYVSRRMAWKLLKDIPKSATRKAARRIPTTTYIFCVSRTTFRGHFLGVLASWIVQISIDVYRFFNSISKTKEDNETVDTKEQLRVLGRRVFGDTAGCIASLICASIGAGIGATLIRPSTGQWIGCILGDFAGPVIITYCAEKLVINL